MKLTRKTAAAGLALILLLACCVITFAEEIPFVSNEAESGGAISLPPKAVEDHIGFVSNQAPTGGSISLPAKAVQFNTGFVSNEAPTGGNAIEPAPIESSTASATDTAVD